MVVVRRYGAPVRISPIGTYASNPECSGAGAAEKAVQAAIWAFHARIEHRAAPEVTA